MKSLIMMTVLSLSLNASAWEILGYKVDGHLVQKAEEASKFISELEKLIEDEDYEMQSELCVVYGEDGDKKLDESLDGFLKEAGYSMELEGIYGDVGTAVFEVYSNVGDYVAAITAEVCQ